MRDRPAELSPLSACDMMKTLLHMWGRTPTARSHLAGPMVEQPEHFDAKSIITARLPNEPPPPWFHAAWVVQQREHAEQHGRDRDPRAPRWL